eukprot:scaffold16434_cov16-Tisochrysis_lutea.AAC.1
MLKVRALGPLCSRCMLLAHCAQGACNACLRCMLLAHRALAQLQAVLFMSIEGSASRAVGGAPEEVMLEGWKPSRAQFVCKCFGFSPYNPDCAGQKAL